MQKNVIGKLVKEQNKLTLQASDKQKAMEEFKEKLHKEINPRWDFQTQIRLMICLPETFGALWSPS